MRRLAVTVLIALSFIWFGACRSCMAQQIIGRPMLPLNSSGPSSIAGIRYWWVSEDLAQGAVTSNWIDRINSYGLGQPTSVNQPTNTTSGVQFNGGQFLTNSPTFGWATNTTGGDAQGSFWFVSSPTTPVGTYGGVVGDSSVSGYGIYTKSDGTFQVFFNCGAGSFGTYVSGSKFDFLTNQTGPAACTNAYYKNGTLIVSGRADGYGGNNTVKFLGKDGSGLFFKGNILEVAWFDRQLTSAQITSLHAYASAKYGY